MQTFLPYPDLAKSAACLDYRRLGKQRVECMQIIEALKRGSGSWYNHPATQMWKNSYYLLRAYHDLCILEWKRRGFKNTMKLYYRLKTDRIAMDLDINLKPEDYPVWWGGPIHANHRGRLLAKNPEWYGQFNWKEAPVLENYWPTKDISYVPTNVT